MIFSLLLVLLILIVALIPIAITYWIYQWLAKKGYKKIGLLILISVIISEGYIIYTAIYPTDSFYKDEFATDTGISFPVSGEIIQKNASYPDMHGDYSATAVFVIDSNDYNEILESIRNNSKFTLNTVSYSFQQGGISFKNNNSQSYCASQTIDQDLICTLYFNQDKRHLFFERYSW